MKKHKNKITLDSLFDRTAPFASFHDARLHKLQIDYAKRELTAEFELSVGNPDAKTDDERERRRSGTLKITDLIYWALEPPEGRVTIGPLWLTSDGLIEEAKTQTAAKLKPILQSELFAWYLYFSDINAFAYLVAKEAEFKWDNA